MSAIIRKITSTGLFVGALLSLRVGFREANGLWLLLSAMLILAAIIVLLLPRLRPTRSNPSNT